MSYEGPGTILGGLPVIAVVSSGKDSDTPDGPGEYWSEVDSIHWRKRDGTKGKALPEHLRDKAKAYDSGFCDLIDQVHTHLSQEEWLRKHGERIVHHPTCNADYPEKPKGEAPRALVVMEDGLINCSDCGAWVDTKVTLT